MRHLKEVLFKNIIGDLKKIYGKNHSSNWYWKLLDFNTVPKVFGRYHLNDHG